MLPLPWTATAPADCSGPLVLAPEANRSETLVSVRPLADEKLMPEPRGPNVMSTLRMVTCARNSEESAQQLLQNNRLMKVC